MLFSSTSEYASRYFLSENLQELENNIQDSFNIKSVKIIEVKTVISENIRTHRNIMEEVKRLITDH